jgi:hypothetical protein
MSTWEKSIRSTETAILTFLGPSIKLKSGCGEELLITLNVNAIELAWAGQ